MVARAKSALPLLEPSNSFEPGQLVAGEVSPRQLGVDWFEKAAAVKAAYHGLAS